MRGAYCYLPILPARGGAFRAVGSLSSDARSRMTPLFNIPAPAPKDKNALDAYLSYRWLQFATTSPRSRYRYFRNCPTTTPKISRSPFGRMTG
ncbi:MAG: hypothetical protein HYU77_03755 [Betaproteobacteria bacterium]|nr:hypothetical protein [Betaproteobacteria bacterium]